MAQKLKNRKHEVGVPLENVTVEIENDSDIDMLESQIEDS